MPHTVQYLTGNIRMSSTFNKDTPSPTLSQCFALIKILTLYNNCNRKKLFLLHSFFKSFFISHGELLQSNFLTQVPDVMTQIFLFTLPEMIATHLIKIKYSLDYFNIQIIKRSRKKSLNSRTSLTDVQELNLFFSIFHLTCFITSCHIRRKCQVNSISILAPYSYPCLKPAKWAETSTAKRVSNVQC